MEHLGQRLGGQSAPSMDPLYPVNAKMDWAGLKPLAPVMFLQLFLGGMCGLAVE